MGQHASEDRKRRRRLLIEPIEDSTWKAFQVLKRSEGRDRHVEVKVLFDTIYRS